MRDDNPLVTRGTDSRGRIDGVHLRRLEVDGGKYLDKTQSRIWSLGEAAPRPEPRATCPNVGNVAAGCFGPAASFNGTAPTAMLVVLPGAVVNVAPDRVTAAADNNHRNCGDVVDYDRVLKTYSNVMIPMMEIRLTGKDE